MKERGQQNWKDELPQGLIDFFDGKNNSNTLSAEEDEEIIQKRAELTLLSEHMIGDLDVISKLSEEENDNKNKSSVNIRTPLIPEDKKEMFFKYITFINNFFGVWIGFVVWITMRVLISFTSLKAGRLTDILSLFPSIVISINNVKNWIAGERIYTRFSAFDLRKRDERLLPMNERRKKNPPVSKELYAGQEPFFFFGKAGGRYIGRKENAEGHIICFGGSGTGKSSSIAIPTLYTWNGALLAIDIKGELSKNAPYRHDNYVLDPFDVESFGYNPFEILETYTDADVVHGIQDIVYAILPGDSKSDVEKDYWVNNARSYLSGMYLWAYKRHMTFVEINELICSRTAKELLTEVGKTYELPTVMRFLGGYTDMNDKTLDCIVSTAKTAVELYAVDGTVQNVIKRKKTIHPGMLLEGGRIYICIREEMIAPWRTFLNMIVNQFLRESSKFPERGGQRILFLIDEFARLGRIRSIEESMATLRSKGVTICLLTQSISQIDAIYGVEHRKIIVDNAAYILVMSARDPVSAEEISKMIGKDWFTQTSITSKGINDTSSTTSKQLLYIIPPEKLGNLGKELILICNSGFCKIEKINIFKDAFPWKG